VIETQEERVKVIKLADIVGKGYRKYWESVKRYLVLTGSRNSKKSCTTAIRFIVNMMKYPDSNLLCIRKIYKDHKDSTYAQLKWAIRKLEVEDLWEARLSPLEIIYKPTGQKILFRGLDDPMSITSITVDVGYLCWCWFEEAYQVNKETDFDMVDGSIRGAVPAPLFKQIALTFNPWNEKHWIKKRWFDVIDEMADVFRTDYRCNEFIDEADIHFFEEMKKKNPRRYKVEGLGEWGIAEGLVFDNWTEKEFDKNELIKTRPGIQSGFGLDFGYTTDPSGFIAFLIDVKKREIFIFDEHYQKGMLNNEIADMLKYKGYAKEEIIADSAEPKSIEEIKRYGIPRIKPARKGKDSVSNGIQFLQQFEIVIHPKCTNTILEFNNYAYQTKDGRVINEPIDDYNHLIDPLRYGVEKFMTGSAIRFLSNKRAA
jgi:phage terminase large subunit